MGRESSTGLLQIEYKALIAFYPGKFLEFVKKLEQGRDVSS